MNKGVRAFGGRDAGASLGEWLEEDKRQSKERVRRDGRNCHTLKSSCYEFSKSHIAMII